MNAMHPNLQNLILAAQALEDLKNDVVFVGGATAILYADNIEESVARPTVDVDCVVEVTAMSEYYKLEEKMRSLGFLNDTSHGAPICRWNKGPLVIDLMPIDEKIIGFSNRWYQDGFNTSQTYKLPDGTDISIFSFPLFIASKTEALLSRGIKDLLTSQDFEDILFCMESRSTFVSDLEKAPAKALDFIARSFAEVSKKSDFELAARGNMPRGLVTERQNQILKMFSKF